MVKSCSVLTRSVTEHYNPEEPAFSAECFGYDPLESTGREWYYEPVDELIYQEYSDREATTWDYLPSNSLNIQVLDARSPDEEPEEYQDENRAMAWKRLRPPTLCTVGKSMCIGALISLLAATFLGTIHTVISCVRLKSLTLSCYNHSDNSLSTQMQWEITISGMICSGFFCIWPFTILILIFRPFQLFRVKRFLCLISFLCHCLDSFYRVSLRALTLSAHVSISSFLARFPLHAIFIICVSLELYVVTNHFCPRSRTIKKLSLFLQLMVPVCFTFLQAQISYYSLYPYYVESNHKFLFALFAPIIGVVLKTFSRICAQRLYNITHPGYSYVTLVPLFYGTAIMFRVLQADLDNLQFIIIIGIVHGAAEVIERSTMVLIDHICYVLWRRKSASWGTFRTPRRDHERLMADIAIMSMLSESTAIVSVNGFIYLHKFLCLRENSLLPLLQLFAKSTLFQLVIEWFFTSVSLAIETRYQNLAVMAVWQKRWKRHLLVAIVNVVPLTIYTSEYLLELITNQNVAKFY